MCCSYLSVWTYWTIWTVVVQPSTYWTIWTVVVQPSTYWTIWTVVVYPIKDWNYGIVSKIQRVRNTKTLRIRSWPPPSRQTKNNAFRNVDPELHNYHQQFTTPEKQNRRPPPYPPFSPLKRSVFVFQTIEFFETIPKRTIGVHPVLAIVWRDNDWITYFTTVFLKFPIRFLTSFHGKLLSSRDL